MKAGVIGRADGGGLASMTMEIARHVQPDRVLVVDLDERFRTQRADPALFRPWCDELFVKHYQRTGFDDEHFLDGLDVCYTAETIYDDRLFSVARAKGVRIVLHVMPELFTAQRRAADVIWAPSLWEIDRLPPTTRLMQVPVALDRFTYRQRTELRTLFFSKGEAMLDRNGWDTVVEALPLVQHPLRLLVRGGAALAPYRVGNVDVEWLPPVANYWETIPPETDALVMPRRYGGLCLPAQEAAAQGILPIMSRVAPQVDWFPPELLVDAAPARTATMQGGEFTVYGCTGQDLAATIDRLAADRPLVAMDSATVRAWAMRRSWDELGLSWQSALQEAGQA